MSYHINPASGRVNICRAHPKYGNCPFGSPQEHFESKEEARSHYEGTQTVAAPLTRKPLVRESGTSGEHNLYKDSPKGVAPSEGKHCDLNYFTERDADQILDRWERPFRTNETDYPLPEAMAINFYQMKGHVNIGAALRQNQVLDTKEAAHLVNLKKALKRGKLTKPLTLFRGLSGAYAEKLAGVKVGELIEESGFSSTTPSEKGALSFVRNEEGVMLQIEAPAGTEAIDLGAGLFSIDEDELLIEAKPLRVKSVTRELLDGVPITRLVVTLQS